MSYQCTEKARTNSHAIQLCRRQSHKVRPLAQKRPPSMFVRTPPIDRTTRQRRYEMIRRMRESAGWVIEGLIPKRWKYKLSYKYGAPKVAKPKRASRKSVSPKGA